jgi:hypothetical protein
MLKNYPRPKKILLFASANTARCRPVLETMTSPIAHSPVLCLVNRVEKPVDIKKWIWDMYL